MKSIIWKTYNLFLSTFVSCFCCSLTGWDYMTSSNCGVNTIFFLNWIYSHFPCIVRWKLAVIIYKHACACVGMKRCQKFNKLLFGTHSGQLWCPRVKDNGVWYLEWWVPQSLDGHKTEDLFNCSLPPASRLLKLVLLPRILINWWCCWYYLDHRHSRILTVLQTLGWTWV